jgi:hypothetical protein
MVKRVSLTVTYRRGRPIAAYFRLPRERGDRVATSQRVDDVLIVDRAEDGRPIGINRLVSPTSIGKNWGLSQLPNRSGRRTHRSAPVSLMKKVCAERVNDFETPA